MKTKKHIHLLATAALLALAACTQDETAIPTGETHATLPYGEYPLQISGVTLDVESSAEPWSAEGPQTRVTEDNTDGKSSVWEWNGSEMIRVQLGDETADYTLNAGQNLTADRQLYWISTDPATVTAWYPTYKTVDLSDQSEGLAYMLKAEVTNATYDNEITLGFTHQLAKVRVVLSGTQASLAQSVEVYGYTTCTNNEGVPVTDNAQQDWLKMKKQTYGNTACWEANVVPGTIDLANFIRLNGHAPATSLTDIPTTLSAGEMYTLNLTVGQPITEITPGNVPTISDDGHYRISGGLGEAVTITGGSPTIYLENASISVGSGPAINVTSGTPTIHVTGENAIETRMSSSNCSAGIYVAEGSSVTIEGSGTDDVLRVTGGTDGAAIGGYSDSGDKPCGNIAIKNVTLHAYAIGNYMFARAPGIGTTGGTCGRIEISSAIVYARSFGDDNRSAPAIGAYESVPEIVITDSEIHAYRGSYGTSYADYIGQGGNSFGYRGGDIQCGTGSITNTTVYKWGYNHSYDTSSNEGSVYYDEEGREIIQ